jgi:2-keto-3-deoxy-L-rhamnonate aldolase RhmA
MNAVKEKLFRGQLTTGGWMQIGHPAVAEIMAKAGFDWVAIDDEHGIIGIETGMNIMNALRGSGTIPMVRVRENNQIVIRRWVDAGARGIIVPMVNNAEIAKEAVQSVKYPPQGKRGFGFCRANAYGADFQEYVRQANEDIVIIAQIEHIDAIKNIDSILDVEGIDGAFIGPYDLSGSLNLTGQLTHPTVQRAVQTMLEACKKHKKAAGLHVVAVDPAQVKKYWEDGFTFIALSLDIVMLRYACEKMLWKTE